MSFGFWKKNEGLTHSPSSWTLNFSKGHVSSKCVWPIHSGSELNGFPYSLKLQSFLRRVLVATCYGRLVRHAPKWILLSSTSSEFWRVPDVVILIFGWICKHVCWHTKLPRLWKKPSEWFELELFCLPGTQDTDSAELHAPHGVGEQKV